jgi:hypothetical protein
MKKSQTMTVLNEEIRVTKEDYISLTDMLRSKDGTFFISDWLRNRNTIEYLGIWERVHNPDFNYGEFDLIKSQAGLNSYKISVKEWVAKTNSIGLQAKAGRYGGTYAHSDIAFEFGMWISPEFKIYLIKEFQRLKVVEQKQLGWDVKRQLTKINDRIHTDAVKESLIPAELTRQQINLVYASEAELLDMALFGITAEEWRASARVKRQHQRSCHDRATRGALELGEHQLSLYSSEDFIGRTGDSAESDCYHSNDFAL